MPKTSKKSMKKVQKKQTKSVKKAKVAKPTLVWKRSKKGRPRAGVSKHAPSELWRVEGEFQRSSKACPERALASRGGVPKEFQRSFKGVSKEFQRSSKGVPRSVPRASPSALASPAGQADSGHSEVGRGIQPEANGGEIRIEQSKFELGPRENSGHFQAHNLPYEYGLNQIILLVVDPTFVFTYWEVQPEKMHEISEKIGHNAKLTLRFHDVNKSASWDVPIYERVGNWYLRLEYPAQALAVEIGLKNDRGDFCVVAQSNTMTMPSMGLASRGPTKWLLVSSSGEKIMTEIEEYTDADLELLKRILGPYFFDLLRRGKFSGLTGSSLENVFTEISGTVPSR